MIVKDKIELGWSLFHLGLLVSSAILITACGGASVQTPSAVPPTPTMEPTVAPSATPTVVPTITPTVAPTNTPRPSAQVSFEWDPNGVRPSDADDVAAIVDDISREESIVSGYGNEQGITLQYDPTLITVQEIQELLGRIGHPVLLENE